MKKLLALFALLPSLAFGVVTTGGINWLESATKAYPKPQFVPINTPDETTAPKYWVKMGSGTAGACSQAAPCNDMGGVLGKPGTQGGPAIIYVQGTGRMDWFDDNIFGSGDFDCRTQACNNWILIKPWPVGSTGCVGQCTATFQDNSNMNSANVNHIMWDGGPDMRIRFNSNVPSANGIYAQNINSNWHIVYRTQTYCAAVQAALGFQVGSSRVADHVYFINNEFHTCRLTGTQASAIYWSPGSNGTPGFSNALIQGNIVRNWGGEGIEINPRVTSNGMQILDNVLYDNGQVTCSTNWRCRPHIVVSTQSGGGTNNVVIRNNLMWNSYSGCMWLRNSPVMTIENNTCYNYALYGDEDDNSPNPGALIEGNSANIVRNNIFHTTANVLAFENSSGSQGTYAANNNICMSAQSCGTSKQTYSAGVFASTDPTSADFLKLASGSVGRDNGANTGVTPDLAGVARPQGAAYDIGALEYVSGGTPAPTLDLQISHTARTLGQPYDLTWTVGGGTATACIATGGTGSDGWVGTKAGTSDTLNVPAASVSSNYSMYCTGTGGTTPTVSRSVTVDAPIVSFSASPLSLFEGQQTRVTWSATNATSCTAASSPTTAWTGSKAATVGPNTEDVTINASTGLNLTCCSTAGCTGAPALSISASALPPPPVITLTANPQTVTAGNASTITWSVTGNVSSCVGLDATQGNVAGWNSAKAIGGGTFNTTALAASGVWTLACSGAGGPGSQTLPITVNAALPEPTVNVTTNPTTQLQGWPYDVLWDSTNAATCTATGAWSALGSIGVRGTISRTDALPATFGVTCTNATGSQSDTATVNIVSNPVVVNFAATVGGSYGTIANGTTWPTGTVIRITWYGQYASSCIATGDYAAAGLSNAGEYNMPALSGDIQVTMTCTNGLNTGAATLNFYEEDIITPPAAPTLTFTASPLNITEGQTSTLTWDSTNALSCLASGGWSGTKAPDGEEDTIPLGRTTRFNLSCTGEGGNIAKEVAVTVRRTYRWPWCRWWRCR